MDRFQDCAETDCRDPEADPESKKEHVFGGQVVTFPSPFAVLTHAAEVVQANLKKIADEAAAELEQQKTNEVISEEQYEEKKQKLPLQPPPAILITGVEAPDGEEEAQLSDEELEAKSKCSYHWVDQVVVGKRMSSKKTTSY